MDDDTVERLLRELEEETIEVAVSRLKQDMGETMPGTPETVFVESRGQCRVLALAIVRRFGHGPAQSDQTSPRTSAIPISALPPQ